MQPHLQELYDVEVSPARISKVTDAIQLMIRTEGRVHTRVMFHRVEELLAALGREAGPAPPRQRSKR